MYVSSHAHAARGPLALPMVQQHPRTPMHDSYANVEGTAIFNCWECVTGVFCEL